MGIIKFDNIEEYIEFQLDLFLLTKARHKKLTKMHRRVYLEHIYCVLDHINLNSTECIERVQKRIKFNYPNDVWQYRSRLYKQGWFVKIPVTSASGRVVNKYKLIPNFDYTKKQLKILKTYKFSIQLDEKNDTGNEESV